MKTAARIKNPWSSVKDYNAHAWVEIYIDHYGWIPVEVTPGTSVGSRSFRKAGIRSGFCRESIDYSISIAITHPNAGAYRGECR